jgi:hypothetical protein
LENLFRDENPRKCPKGVLSGEVAEFLQHCNAVSDQQMEATMTTMQGAYNGVRALINNFTETSAVGFYWIGGGVFVQGRVRILNEDTDYQLFKIWLTHGNPRNTMDYVEWNLPGNSEWTMVYLSGWAFDLPPPTKSSKWFARPIVGILTQLG